MTDNVFVIYQHRFTGRIPIWYTPDKDKAVATLIKCSEYSSEHGYSMRYEPVPHGEIKL